MSIMPQPRPGEDSLMPQAIYSPENEKAVLGCLMAEPEKLMDEAVLRLEKEDFFVPAYQEIFKALCEIHKERKPIEVMIVHQWLTDRKLAEPLGSPGVLSDLLLGFATHLSFSHYVKIVKDKALLRALQSACSEIVQQIHDAPDSVPDVLGHAQKLVEDISDRGLSQNAPVLSTEQAVARFFEWQGGIQAGLIQPRLKTGFGAFDDLNGGLMPGEMHVVAARAGIGKSVVCLNLLENIAGAGSHVGLISLEMTSNQVMKRVFSFVAGIDGRNFNQPMHDAEWLRVQAARSRVQSWKFSIDESTQMNIHDLRAKCRKMGRNGVDCILLDYIQLLDSVDYKSPRHEELRVISRGIKLLAKEMEIPIVVAAQLNRAAMGSERPELHHLAQSGSLEQDAAVVMLLYKDGDDICNSSSIPYFWEVAKYRDGAIGQLKMRFNAPHSRFFDAPKMI